MKVTGRRVLRWVGVVAVVAALVWLSGVRLFAFAGDSMVPTVRAGDRMVGLVGPWGWRTPNRFDLLIFDVPSTSKWAGQKIPWMKRLVGLPREHVRVSGAKVFINGRPLDAPHFHLDPSVSKRSDFEATLGDDEYFVLGDNLDHTAEDSRVLGPIHGRLVRGFVLFVLPAAPKPR